MSLLLALALALQAREEVVEVPKTDLKLSLIHVPVEGASLRPYALGKAETPWAEILVFQGWTEDRGIDGITRPSSVAGLLEQLGMPPGSLEPARPASVLRWHTAMAYCDWLTMRTGRKFRLPTEPEWERAAKGEGGDVAPFRGGGRDAAASRPNAMGFKDLVGNVWELCLEPLDPVGFGPVYRGGSWQTPAERLAADLRTGIQRDWTELDATRPRSQWWLFGGAAQGMRPALVGDAEAVRASQAYAPKLEIRIQGFKERDVRLGTGAGDPGPVERVVAVRGEVRNAGDRAIDELELQVYYLDPKGEPHRLEQDGASGAGRPNFTWIYPVLANSVREGPRKPLGSGETREFVADLPRTYDADVFVKEDAFGARATWVRLAPR